MPKLLRKDYARDFAPRANTPQPNGYRELNLIEQKSRAPPRDPGSVRLLSQVRCGQHITAGPRGANQTAAPAVATICGRAASVVSRAEFSVTDGPHLRKMEVCLRRYSFTNTPTFYVASSNRIEGQ